MMVEVTLLSKTSHTVRKLLEFLKDRPLYAEKWCPFTKRIGCDGCQIIRREVFAYPTVETIHENNICHLVYAPARIPDTLAKKASILAKMQLSHSRVWYFRC